MKKNALSIFLEMHRISYSTGTDSILNDLNLSIAPGSVHALVGKHGGGKSTLCKILSGLVIPSNGIITINGKFQLKWNFSKSRKKGIIYIPQYFHLLEHLSVMENFLVSRRSWKDLFYINRKRLKNAVENILNESGFNISANTEVRDLPKSQSVALSVVLQLALKPRLLILDEILDRLEPDDQSKVIKLLQKHKEEHGLSVLWITHNIDEVGNFADTISVFRKGRIIFSSPAEDIDKRNLIKLSYNQISKEAISEHDIAEFYNLLKYNEAILLHLPVNLLVLDPHKTIRLINLRGRKFFSINQDIRNKNIESLLGEDNVTIIERIDKALEKQEEITHYELPLNINNHHLEINLVIFPIIDDNEYIGCILIIEDVTEKEYLRKQAILAERLSSIGLLAAGVAHEINNPLEVISNNLNYLRFDIEDEEREEVITELEEEVLHINKILKNIFLASDRKQQQTSSINIITLTSKLIHLLRHNADKSNIEIKFIKHVPEIILKASTTEIREILLNLMKNSFDALDNGGKITIEENIDHEKQIAIIRHRDNGSGIPEEIIPDIFLPFSTTKQDKENNMGLGLSIVYNIVKNNSGHISVSNLPNAGCEFTITLPLKNISKQAYGS